MNDSIPEKHQLTQFQLRIDILWDNVFDKLITVGYRKNAFTWIDDSDTTVLYVDSLAELTKLAAELKSILKNNFVFKVNGEFSDNLHYEFGHFKGETG